MRILIDAHILLWCLEDSPKLTVAARQLIEDPDNEIYVSKATAWEIEIKRMLGKLTIADDFMERIDEGFCWLPIELRHIKELRALPSIHRDPFDRMLVAQAKCESMTLLSHDDDLPQYGDFVRRV